MPKSGNAGLSEAKVKAEVIKRGGAVKVRTIHPNPRNPEEYAHIYVVRKKGTAWR